MDYYDNRNAKVVEWLAESASDGIIRIATGFVKLDGLCSFLETIPEDASVRILTGTALEGGQATDTELIDTFDTDLGGPDFGGSHRNLQSLYDRLRGEVSIRGLPSLHAKLYLFENVGLVGSSNLTDSGLRSEFEYNTELSSEQHVDAVEWFDEQWEEGEELTAEFVETIESSDHGVEVVDVPITDHERLRRVTDVPKKTAEQIASCSLAGQIARLDDEVDFLETNSGHVEHGLGAYGVETRGDIDEYLTRLLDTAARVRDAPASFSEIVEKLAPEHNDAIWRTLRADGTAPDLPVKPEGLAWYLEWSLRDPSLSNLPNDLTNLEPVDGPILTLKPWRHQQRALEKWATNDYRGVVEMATGTGKTVVGLDAIMQTYQSRKDPSPVEILVTAHTNPLVEQWCEEIEDKLGVTSDPDGERFSSRFFQIRVVTPQKIISNFDTFSGRTYDLVVVDEVHHYQNNVDGWGRVVGLDTDRILGLSAELSGERLRAIEETLGPVVFEYSQQEAIDDGIVPEFKWQLHPVQLNQDEREEYVNLSESIKGIFDDIRSSSETEELAREHKMQVEDLGDYFQLRARIRSEPPSTWQKLDAYIRLRRQIVYESKRAITQAKALAKEYLNQDLKMLIFTMTIESAEEIVEDIPSAEALHSEREQDTDAILERFRKSTNNVNVLVGVRMLDEGIDVPEADVAINVAAEKTQKQLIQRQGRILRRNGRHVPIFHHFVVEEEVEYYSNLGSVEPEIVENPHSVMENRLPTTVGTVDVWDIYRSLTPNQLVELNEAESLEAADFLGDEWWLNIYRDEYPELFAERLQTDIADGE